MKMPLAFADQFYVLREHIGFVWQRLAQTPVAAHETEAPAHTQADDTATHADA